MDLYKNFNQLSESLKVNQDYLIEYQDYTSSEILVFTPHGGGIEPGTTEIVKEIANSDMSWYSFTAKMNKDNNLMHITSINFDESQCIYMINKSSITLAIHGCKDKQPIIYVGGKDIEISNKLYQSLKNNFPDINIISCHENTTLFNGFHKNNIVNKNKKLAGVQLEFSYGLRKLMFENVDKHVGRVNKTELFYDIIFVIRQALTK